MAAGSSVKLVLLYRITLPHIPDEFILIWSSTVDLHLKYNKKSWEDLNACLRLLRHGPHREDASNSYSIVVCVFVAAVTFLLSRSLATIGDTQIDTQTGERDL
jgi:hypothetical protein